MTSNFLFRTFSQPDFLYAIILNRALTAVVIDWWRTRNQCYTERFAQQRAAVFRAGVSLPLPRALRTGVDRLFVVRMAHGHAALYPYAGGGELAVMRRNGAKLSS